MKLSEKIVLLRKQNGLSQEALAEKLGVSRQAVSRWETGTALPDASNLLQLSDLFGVTADSLLREETPLCAAPANQPGAQWPRFLAPFLLCAGLLGNLTLYIVSRFVRVMVPHISRVDGQTLYTWRSDLTGYSYKYFVETYSLELLTALFWVLAVVGLLLTQRKRFPAVAARLRTLRKRLSAFAGKLHARFPRRKPSTDDSQKSSEPQP